VSQSGKLNYNTVPAGLVVQTLTGNDAVVVSPSALNNINIVGSGGVTVTGNAITHTLVITAGTSQLNYTNVTTSPYVVQSTDDIMSVDCSGGPITIQLPNSSADGRVYIVKDRTGNANVNNITITTVGAGVNIDGFVTYDMNTQYGSVEITFGNSVYQVL
jgi:hypothetical protein